GARRVGRGGRRRKRRGMNRRNRAAQHEDRDATLGRALWAHYSADRGNSHMRFVYVMDPMDRVLPDKDTTFAFQRAAQARGHESLHCEPRDLFVKDAEVYARVRHLTVSDATPHVSWGSTEDVRLADVDAVLIRKDPPFDQMYLF